MIIDLDMINALSAADNTFMSIYIPKKVPDQDYYVIGDFTMATTDGAIEDFTTATSDDAIGLNSSCVVVVVL